MLSRQLHSHDARDLRGEMLELPAFREKVDAPGWRDLLALAPQLMHAPRGLGQHVGGMILSDSPLTEMVPVRESAIEGRYIMDWNKDSTADAGFAKIDLLSLPVLDQIEEALDLVEQREGSRPDISAIDPEDSAVYEMLSEGRSKGVFLLQSPAQLKMGQRLQPRNLLDLAYQVALIRPGVGVQGSAVSKFVDRYRHGVEWDYDHPLERRALERGCGIIVWQEQVVQLISDVAGMKTSEADEIRRAFARPNNDHLIAMHRRKFLEGALANGVPQDIAEKIFEKINGHYMFPESHSHAFAVTAYQAAWLKSHHPLEFFVALMNSQPMGFYPMETIKEDARRFGVPFLNPCVNRSGVNCIPEKDSVLLGLGKVRDVGEESARLIVQERERHGPLLGCRGPGSEDGPQTPGCPLPRNGRSLRWRDCQPQGGSMGCGPPRPPSEKWPKGPARCPRETASPTFPTSPIKRKWPGSTPSWASTPGATSWSSSGLPSALMSSAPPTSTPSPRAKMCWLPAGPWPGSTPGEWRAPCSSPSRTRPGTCSSSSGPGSSPGTRGSWETTCSWPGASSPATTAPLT